MGRLNGNADGGYVLLDALVALCIVVVGFSVFLGGIGLAGRIASRRLEAALGLIEQRNAHERERTVSFGTP
jgi:hypothetical protein